MIDLHVVLNWIAYWVLFWTIVNLLLPPREVFGIAPDAKHWYNTLLKLVAYYGALNVRQVSVKLYAAVQGSTEAPSK